MIVTAYGYSVPETGDKGAPLFTALADDITRVSGHTHNGADSAPLTAQSLVGITQSILSASWVASGPTGHYRQQVTVPAGFDFDLVQIGFRTTAGVVIMPTVERVSDTQFFVYTIDNTADMVAIYGG